MGFTFAVHVGSRARGAVSGTDDYRGDWPGPRMTKYGALNIKKRVRGPDMPQFSPDIVTFDDGPGLGMWDDNHRRNTSSLSKCWHNKLRRCSFPTMISRRCSPQAMRAAR